MPVDKVNVSINFLIATAVCRYTVHCVESVRLTYVCGVATNFYDGV